MKENILEGIIAESYRHEYEPFNNASEHNFTLRHRIAMKQIFARYEMTVIKSKQRKYKSKLDAGSNKQRLSIKQRALIIALIVILMAMLVGWIAVFVSREFYGTVHRNYTTLAVVNMDNCPKTIEYKYILHDVPDGFEVVETSSSPMIEHTVYYNSLTNQSIDIMQWVKTSYHQNYNTEQNYIEEIEINGHIGLCIDFSDSEHYSSLITWDNDDYIIEIGGDFTKDDLVNLAKSVKLLEI